MAKQGLHFCYQQPFLSKKCHALFWTLDTQRWRFIVALTAVFSAIGGLANDPEHSASGEWRGDGAARITELLEENRQKVTLRRKGSFILDAWRHSVRRAFWSQKV